MLTGSGRILLNLVILGLLLAGGCARHSSGKLHVAQHGVVDGEPVNLWTIDNGQGLSVEVMDHGAALVSIRMEDAGGDGLLLGDASFASPVDGEAYLGAITGKGLDLEQGRWVGSPFNSTDGLGVRFRLAASASDLAGQGRIDAEVDYVLTEDDELRIIMKATSQEVADFDMSHRACLHIPDHRRLLPCGQRLSIESAGSSNQNATDYMLEEAIGQLHLAAELVDSSDVRLMSVWTDRPVLRIEPMVESGNAEAESELIGLSSPSEVDGKQVEAALVPGRPYRHVIEYRFHRD